MTAVEFLFNELWEAQKSKLIWHSILEKAKEMERLQLIDAYDKCYQDLSNTQKQVDKLATYVSELPQTEISDEEIEKAVNEYANVYQCPSELKMCKHDVISAWNNAIKWYREQLKKK